MTSHTARNPVGQWDDGSGTLAAVQKTYVTRYEIHHPMGGVIKVQGHEEVCANEEVAILERKFAALEREILLRVAHESGSAGEWHDE